MAQSYYALDLDSGVMPMLSEQQSRTYIGSTAGEDSDEREEVGVAYCHNVMPSRYGYDAVGYIEEVAAYSADYDFSSMSIIYGTNKTRLHLAWDTYGNAYILLSGATAWEAISSVALDVTGDDFDANDISIATVEGITYIYYSGIGCMQYDEDTAELTEVDLDGLEDSEVVALVGSYGRLIAFTDTAVAWGSTITPTDFEPSDITGAGGGNVSNVAGKIKFAVPNPEGFIVYTDGNAIAGTYTGNDSYPYKLAEIPGSRGGITKDTVTYEDNSSTQFAYTKAGLQTVTTSEMEAVLPRVTDFVAGKRFEDFDEDTLSLSITSLSTGETMLKKLRYIGSRYLILSYGLPSVGLTHSLVYDVKLERLGKLKIPHVDIVEYIGEQDEISKEHIAYLQADGTLSVVDFSTDSALSGVMIMGKLQYTKSYRMQILGLELENVPEGFSLDVYLQKSLDGKNVDSTVQGTERINEGNLREYYFRETGKNFNFLLIGAFNLVTMIARYKPTSRR